MLKGFRDFILRGNVVDLAVAVIIGGAFGAIINSLVKDIITPLIAAIVGKQDFSKLVFNIHGGVVTYGNFLNAAISFLLIGSAVYFFLVMPMQYVLRKIHGPAAATTKPCPECQSEIPLTARRCKFCAQPVA